jgi:hypothetical protein
MIHRRGVLPVLVLLLAVLVGTVVAIVRGPAAATPTHPSAAQAPPAPVTGAARGVVRSLLAVEHAYADGDVRRLCRPGALVDPAVIRSRSHASCESRLESLMANVPALKLTLRGLTLRQDLATATVRTPSGRTVPVDLVRDGGRWLLSFSDGTDPFPALAGTG